MAERAKPGVGRIVWFYDLGLFSSKHKNLDGNGGLVDLNGAGKGPYAAQVIQDWPGDYVNLRVQAWGGSWSEGSVEEFDEKKNQQRYWVWPPRD